jgi:hypothetical protein
LNILVWNLSKIAACKKRFFFADFALQNMVETTLPDGIETSGQRAYCYVGISQDVLSFCVLDDFFRFSTKIGFLGILGPPGNHASRWIRDLWSKGVSLILSYFYTFLSFCVFGDFFCFSKKL